MKNPKNIFIINAHQYYPGSPGKLNESLVEFARDLFQKNHWNVEITAIEGGYSPELEADKHEWADLIITQTPVYWFGGPWIYKKYIDEVFGVIIRRQNLAISDGRSRNHAQQYGTGGLPHGKQFLLSTTWNAPAAAFDDSDQFLLNGKSLDEAMVSMTTVYKFCGFEILKNFGCFDVKKNPRIEDDFQRYQQRLLEIINL